MFANVVVVAVFTALLLAAEDELRAEDDLSEAELCAATRAGMVPRDTRSWAGVEGNITRMKGDGDL